MSSSSARSSWGPRPPRAGRAADQLLMRARGRSGSSAPRAIRSARSPGAPKRSAIARRAAPRARRAFARRAARACRAAGSAPRFLAPAPATGRRTGCSERIASAPPAACDRRRAAARGDDRRRAPGAHPPRRGVGAEPGRPGADRAGGSATAGRARGPPRDRRRSHAAARPRRTPRRAPGLDRGADPLQRAQRSLPGRLGALGVGRHQDQLRAARERLAEPHPGADAERLGRPRDLADHLRPARLGRQRHRPSEQLPALPQGAAELQSRGMRAQARSCIEHMFV